MPHARVLAVLLCLVSVVGTSVPRIAAGEDTSEPIVVEDPHYGEVLFYFYQEDYFPAIVRLLAARQRGQLEDHVAEADLLLGGLLLSYGNHLDAAEIFARLLEGNAATAIRDRTWFFLAKIWQQRGYLARAQAALDRLSPDLPGNLRREAQMLEAQLLIDSGRYDPAIELLTAWEDPSDWRNYAQYNLGVALARSGRVGEAAGILDRLGELDSRNQELIALRDKANLALGYALLKDGRAHAAKSSLQRVRLEGPFSNKALLGVGWADAESRNYRRALVPWMELRGRDLLDAAVQESLLAIPYALAQLDSTSQAADHYLNAIEAFHEEMNRLDRTIGFIESGEIFAEFIAADPLDGTGWYWRLDELPDGPEARYLYHLLATHEFQEGLKNYRDLAFLKRNLDDWQRNIVVYTNMLETRRDAYDMRLPVVTDALQRADVDELVDRKLAFDALLNGIAEADDWLALANEREFELWGEIAGLESTPALAADIPQAGKVRDKLRLLRGVLQWRLERDFKDRLWRARRELKAAGNALVATQRSRRQIADSLATEPGRFADLTLRVDALGPRIEMMQRRVAETMAQQHAFLQAIAVGELQAQKHRLDIYTVQARFALAAIYDIAATNGGEAKP